MSKEIVLSVDVHFGDCDPAGIVFFPNFLRLDGRCLAPLFQGVRLALGEIS